MTMHWFKKTIIATMMITALTQTVSAAGLDAQVNTATVAAGDSFQLTLTTSDTAVTTPDLSPLGVDFEILGTSQSSQTQIINGRRSSQKSWIVTLSPRKKGELAIPAITAGSVSSDAASIRVVAASEMPKAVGVSGISLTAALGKGSHYIYQEIPLKVRIETPYALQQTSLVAPQGNDFELNQVGEDKSSQEVRNGQPVNIIERDYMLRSQKDGDISLPPFVLQGKIADPNSRSDPFAGFPFDSSMMQDFGIGRMFSQGKPFKVRSDALELTILDNPNSSKDDWFLPAKAVELKAEWLDAKPSFKVGEAISRKISLLALGARPEQLPKLDPGYPVNAKLYIDNTSVDTVQTKEGTVARRDILVSVVPTAAGEITLPEIKVQWLDTQNNQSRTAILPAEVIKVTGVPVDQASDTAATISSSAAMAAPKSDKPDQVTNYYWLTSIGVLGVVLLVIGGLIWQRQRQMKEKDNSIKTTSVTAQLNLKKAIKSQDASKIYDALLAWKRTEPKYLMPEALKQEIRKLETFLFNSKDTDDKSTVKNWDTQTLNDVLKHVITPSSTQLKQNKFLPSLYPSQSA